MLKTDAIIIKSQPIGEADRVITLLTRRGGKIRAAARGARRPKSRLASSTQLFTCASCLIFINEDSLSNLSQCQIKDSHVEIRTDLYKMAAASYVAELINEMVEEYEPLEKVYFLLQRFLLRLEGAAESHIGPLLVIMELKLLQFLGYQPSLNECVLCGNCIDTEGKPVGFSINEGGVICSDCLSQGGKAIDHRMIKVMDDILKSRYRKRGSLHVPPDIRGELEELLHAFIVYHLGRELHSWEFLSSMKMSG